MLWSRRTSRATAAARRLQSVRPENRIPRATRRESSPTMSPVAESMESRLLLTTYYVNATGGNDSINDGKSDAQAWATLQRAAPPERCLRRRALRLRRPGQAAAAALLRSHLSGHVLGQRNGARADVARARFRRRLPPNELVATTSAATRARAAESECGSPAPPLAANPAPDPPPPAMRVEAGR